MRARCCSSAAVRTRPRPAAPLSAEAATKPSQLWGYWLSGAASLSTATATSCAKAPTSAYSSSSRYTNCSAFDRGKAACPLHLSTECSHHLSCASQCETAAEVAVAGIAGAAVPPCSRLTPLGLRCRRLQRHRLRRSGSAGGRLAHLRRRATRLGAGQAFTAVAGRKPTVGQTAAAESFAVYCH